MFCNKTGNPQVMAGTTILGTKTLTLTLLKNLGGKSFQERRTKGETGPVFCCTHALFQLHCKL
jgi:hypothetical protein